MSEQKDPIAEQIERDANAASISGGLPFMHGYKEGATAQDRIATNRTVDAAIAIVKEYATIYDEGVILKELEKLRR